MAVTTKKTFSATTNATTTVFSPVSIQLNNQDDLDVYFPAVSAGTTLYNYQLSTDNNTITFNSALPQGAVVFCERRTRDADSSYTTFASGSTIRATDLNNSSTESNFTAQDGRNKALTIEGVLFRGDQPSTNFITTDHIVAGTIVNNDIANDAVNGNKIADDSINSEHYAAGSIDLEHMSANSIDSDQYVDGSIDRVHLEADIIDSTKLADNAVNSEHYVDGSIDHEHLSNDCVDEDNIQDDSIRAEHIKENEVTDSEIATGTLDNRYYTETELNAGQLDTRYFTESELTGGALDGRYFTESEAEAAFLRQDSSETIASGVTWSSTDSKVATTAAIDARIIDLVDDVGGFVPLANETSFPNANPDVNNGAGTLVSIKALSQNYTSNSSGVITIANGTTVQNSTVTITGAGNSVTYPAGFGMIVETTVNTNQYAFHRLVPKATEVTTVAANAVNIAAAGANVVDINNFADLYQISQNAPTQRADTSALQVGDLWFDSSSNKVLMIYDNSSGDGFTAATPNASDLVNINIVAGQITFQEDLGLITNAVNTGTGNNSVNTVAGSIANVNTAATNIAKITTVADDLNEGTSEIDTVATNIANVNTVGNAIGNVNTVAGSIANVNTVQGSISNVNTAATNIASINTTAASITNVNNFTDRYQVASSNPSTDGGGNALAAGDLYFNTSANELKVYSGSQWQGGVTATGSFAATTGNTFTGSNIHNDNVKSIYGTSSDGMEIFHNASDSVINDTGTGNLKLQTGGSTKLEILSTGATVTGLMTATTIDGAAGNNLQLDFGTL